MSISLTSFSCFIKPQSKIIILNKKNQKISTIRRAPLHRSAISMPAKYSNVPLLRLPVNFKARSQLLCIKESYTINIYIKPVTSIQILSSAELQDDPLLESFEIINCNQKKKITPTNSIENLSEISREHNESFDDIDFFLKTSKKSENSGLKKEEVDCAGAENISIEYFHNKNDDFFLNEDRKDKEIDLSLSDSISEINTSSDDKEFRIFLYSPEGNNKFQLFPKKDFAVECLVKESKAIENEKKNFFRNFKTLPKPPTALSGQVKKQQSIYEIREMKSLGSKKTLKNEINKLTPQSIKIKSENAARPARGIIKSVSLSTVKSFSSSPYKQQWEKRLISQYISSDIQTHKTKNLLPKIKVRKFLKLNRKLL